MLTVKATFVEVLPRSGLAYAIDDQDRTWTITQQMSSVPLDVCQEGGVCTLTIAQLSDFDVVERCDLASQG